MSRVDFVATLVAPVGAVLDAAGLAVVRTDLARAGSGVGAPVSLAGGRAADIFFSAPSVPQDVGQGFPFDVFIQPVATRRKKLLVADMESTIIEQEMLDEMAAKIGVGEKVALITRRAMNGELDFDSALTERVALLKGQPESLLRECAAQMTLMQGAPSLLAAMKEAGAKCWLVSGGFTFFIKKIADQLGFDRFFGNELIVENGVLTGEVGRPILGKNAKKEFLAQACATYGCRLDETLTIGDGANDIPMLQTCAAGGGLGVAFRAKPKVREIIANQINYSDLSALVYAQGLE